MCIYIERETLKWTTLECSCWAVLTVLSRKSVSCGDILWNTTCERTFSRPHLVDQVGVIQPDILPSIHHLYVRSS